jgi:hypothetical protein
MRMPDYPLVNKLLCVALVAALMLPLGRMIFPHLGDSLSGMQFEAIEAVVSASLGFGLYSLFG